MVFAVILSCHFGCGTNTGFYITFKNGPFLLRAFRIRPGHYNEARDPSTITIEGSNLADTFLTLGSSWTLIYNGSTGLTTDPGRKMLGQTRTITKLDVVFKLPSSCHYKKR